MAVTFVAAGTGTSGDGNVALSVSLPAGLTVGDYLILAHFATGVTGLPTLAASNGNWAVIRQNLFNSMGLSLWGAYYDADIASSISVPASAGGGSGEASIGQIVAFNSNTAGLRPAFKTQSNVSSGSASQNIGSIVTTGLSSTTIAAGEVVIVIGGKGVDWTSVATLSQASFTFNEIGEPDRSESVFSGGMVWDRGTASSVAITAKTFTVTGGSTADWQGWMFVLNEESAPQPFDKRWGGIPHKGTGNFVESHQRWYRRESGLHAPSYMKKVA